MATAARLHILVVLLLLASVAAGCAERPGEAEPPGPTATTTTTAAAVEPAAATSAASGGVFRVGVESSFGFTDGFDPTGEYINTAWTIYSNLLVRTLVGYGHLPGAAGSELVPDLAASLPEVSDGGLTYTLHLKDGIRFAPPVSREITSADVVYAFERIGTPSLVAQYGYFYSVIEGMDEFSAGKRGSITGIETPDEKTIVFHLVEPAGDFAYRLALPATGPIPEEVAGCFDEPGEYGRYLVASGPYMIAGSAELDPSSCETLRPLAGFDPDSRLSLVRNPGYDPATDTPESREALVDGFEFVINTNASDILAKIEAGELDAEIASVTGKTLRRYGEDPELAGRLRLDLTDTIQYVSMNLSQPPFDDVHVRRAVNLVLDKAGMRRAMGGPSIGEIATHVVPDPVLGGLLAGYDPYATPGSGGNVEAARAQMRQSRYDEDGDGICDRPECRGIVHVAFAADWNRRITPVIEDSLAKIGIDLKTRTLSDPGGPLTTVARNIPITSAFGWAKDYADAISYITLFDGRLIIPTGNVNLSLVGLTEKQARSFEGFDGNASEIPSVDARIDACAELRGEERQACWAKLDRTLMEDVVPWAPFLILAEATVVGPAVTQVEFDQATGQIALAHVAVDPAEQR